MEVRSDAWIAARRCWQAAVEHLEIGDFRTAGALFAAWRRYEDRYRREREGLEDLAPRAGHAHTVGLVGDLRVFSE